jgi:3-hydroxyisobutyrate dehydrogenase-like beta-hydroxyacid dehydrogenase
MTSIGFLGLGSMGSALAHRLVAAGHDVVVWNRSPERAREHVAAGARLAADPGEALARDVSFSMLADDDAALAVLDAASVAHAAGGIHVNTASISPAAADTLQERFAAAGARYVAAPVLGRPSVAAEGRLNILAGGDEATVTEVTPLLEVLGTRVWRMGETPSTANAVKIAVNYNIIHAIQAIGESLALVEARGVSGAQFVDLLTSTLFDGVVYRGYGREIVDGAYDPPGFEIGLGFKDLRLAEEIAADRGVRLPTVAALRAVFERALADPELAHYDWGAAAEVTRRGLL